MTSIFKDDTAKQTMLDWYERFRARLTVPTESRQVPTRFGDTHVLVGGAATAPPVVIVHGAMASSAHLLVELAALLETHRVYAVDVIGQSPKTPHARPSVKNNDYGIWLAEVLDGLGLQRVPLVALSWGGFVAVRLAAHAPSLAVTEVIPNCKHCPPTTDEFRDWLGGRLHGFLGGRASAAVAS